MTRPRPDVIVFLGPQGSGKGTQATLLAERLRLPAISTGGLYRDEVAKGTRLGKLAARFIMKGHLAPDEVTNALVAWRLSEKDVRKGAILDGYPRTLGQVGAFERVAAPRKIIVIVVPDRMAIARISGRRVCTRCDENFHVRFRPSKKAGVCDRCGGRLVQRPDDYPTAVKKRLAIYHRNTEPVLAVYDKLGILAEVDGRRSVEAVAKDVWKAVRVARAGRKGK